MWTANSLSNLINGARILLRKPLKSSQSIARLCSAIRNPPHSVPDNVKYPDGNQKLDKYLDRLKESSVKRSSKSSNLDLVTSILRSYEDRLAIVAQYTELIQQINDDADTEFRTLADEEFAKYHEVLSEIDASLVDRMVAMEEDDDDVSSFVLEVTAGVGGLEATLFADDIFRMYANYAKHKSWHYNFLGQNNAILIRDADAYETLKYEAGIHRVQRVPATERQGRIHTSTAAVLIIPCAQDIDIKINRNDLKIENKRASGPGGQSVNKSESAIRLTHLPTGIVVECQEQRTATKNQQIAMEKLSSRLYEVEFKKQQSTTTNIRKAQAGGRGRNEKVRTYNFNRHQVTDHRLGSSGGSIRSLEEFLNGGECFDEFITRVRRFQRKQQLKAILDD